MAGITRGGSGPQRTMLPSQELLDDLCRYRGFRFLPPSCVEEGHCENRHGHVV